MNVGGFSRVVPAVTVELIRLCVQRMGPRVSGQEPRSPREPFLQRHDEGVVTGTVHRKRELQGGKIRIRPDRCGGPNRRPVRQDCIGEWLIVIVSSQQLAAPGKKPACLEDKARQQFSLDVQVVLQQIWRSCNMIAGHQRYGWRQTEQRRRSNRKPGEDADLQHGFRRVESIIPIIARHVFLIENSETAANRCFSVASRVPGESESRSDIFQ